MARGGGRGHRRGRRFHRVGKGGTKNRKKKVVRDERGNRLPAQLKT